MARVPTFFFLNSSTCGGLNHTQACLPPLLAAQAAAPPSGGARRALLAALAACIVHAPPPLLRAQAARTVPLLVQWLQLSAAAIDPAAPPPSTAPPAVERSTAPSHAEPPSAALDGRAVQLLVDLVAVLRLSRWPTPHLDWILQIEAQSKTWPRAQLMTAGPTLLPRCSARCCRISPRRPRRS